MKTACLILGNNYFAHNNRDNKQVRGRAVASAFTQILANIYMFDRKHVNIS